MGPLRQPSPEGAVTIEGLGLEEGFEGEELSVGVRSVVESHGACG